MKFLKKLHNTLLPQAKNLGVMPYVWLIYLNIYFFNYWFKDASPKELWLNSFLIPLFILTYFSSFRRRGMSYYAHVLTIFLIGAILSSFNYGASVFFVYAASLCANFKSAKKSFIAIAIILLSIGILSYGLSLSPYFYLNALFFTALIGFSNIYYVQIERKNEQLNQSHKKIKTLAISNERERIARDLHDLMGHTFSLINKKAELAKKLIDTDPSLAKQELSDIESESRRSLSQVRSALSNLQKRSFSAELENSKQLLITSDIQCELNIGELSEVEDSPLLSHQLAWIVREAITNIVRHSVATFCQLSAEIKQKKLFLSIINDGASTSITEGNGLKGIRERVAELGATINIKNNEVFSIHIEVPCE